MRLASLLLVACFALTACNGGGDPAGPQDPDPGGPQGPGGPLNVVPVLPFFYVKDLPLVDAFHIDQNDMGPTPSYVVVGDSAYANSQYRGFYRFDSSIIPAGAEILTATLKIPFDPALNYGTALSDLGQLKIDHLGHDGVDMSGLVAFFGYTLNFEFAPLQQVGQAYHVDVADVLQQTVDESRTRFNVRMYFTDSSDYDSFRDVLGFANHATLHVTYKN